MDPTMDLASNLTRSNGGPIFYEQLAEPVDSMDMADDGGPSTNFNSVCSPGSSLADEQPSVKRHAVHCLRYI